MADGGDAVRDGHVFQAFAVLERRIADGGDAVRDGHAGQAGAGRERRPADNLCILVNVACSNGTTGRMYQCNIGIRCIA